jgi:hypothetical protein
MTTTQNTSPDTNSPIIDCIQIIDLFNERFHFLSELDRVDSEQALSIKDNKELRKEITNELAKIQKMINAIYETQNN